MFLEFWLVSQRLVSQDSRLHRDSKAKRMMLLHSSGKGLQDIDCEKEGGLCFERSKSIERVQRVKERSR